MVSRAIVLIDDDRVLDISHQCIHEDNSFDVTTSICSPGLDPEPVLSVGKHYGFSRHISYTLHLESVPLLA